MRRRRDAAAGRGLAALGLGALAAGALAWRFAPRRLPRPFRARTPDEDAEEPEVFMPNDMPLHVGFAVFGVLVFLVVAGLAAAAIVKREFQLQDTIARPEIGFAGSHVFARQPEQRRGTEDRAADDLAAGAGIAAAMGRVVARGSEAYAPLPPAAIPGGPGSPP